jgi:hypothetical protein
MPPEKDAQKKDWTQRCWALPAGLFIEQNLPHDDPKMEKKRFLKDLYCGSYP